MREKRLVQQIQQTYYTNNRNFKKEKEQMKVTVENHLEMEKCI